MRSECVSKEPGSREPLQGDWRSKHFVVVVESFGTPLNKKLRIWQKVPQSACLTEGVKSYLGNAQIDGVAFIEGALYIWCSSFHLV